MNADRTYSEIASDYRLWSEFVDTDATMTSDEFDEMPTEAKIEIITWAFGPEQQQVQ